MQGTVVEARERAPGRCGRVSGSRQRAPALNVGGQELFGAVRALQFGVPEGELQECRLCRRPSCNAACTWRLLAPCEVHCLTCCQTGTISLRTSNPYGSRVAGVIGARHWSCKEPHR
jgi:hypothetical protein